MFCDDLYRKKLSLIILCSIDATPLGVDLQVELAAVQRGCVPGPRRPSASKTSADPAVRAAACPLTAFSITRSGASSQQFLQRDRFQVTDVSRVMVIHLVLFLVARDPHFLGIHNDNVIAGVHVRREFRLVLATQSVRNLSRQTTEGSCSWHQPRTSRGVPLLAWQKTSS